jgi:hypothetical protein
VYFAHVLSRLHGIKDISKYSKNLYLSRYELLFPKESLFMQKNLQQFKCYKNKKSFYNSLIANLNRDLIEETASLVASKLNAPELDKSTKWLWMGNYLDAVLK